MTKGILDEIFNVPGWEDENLSVVKEAPDDENPSGGSNAPTNDEGNGGTDNNAEDAPQDQEENQDQGENNQDNDDQQDNFDIDTDNTDGGEEGEGQEQGEDQGDQGGNGEQQDEQPEDEEDASEESKNLKDTYDQLYKDLTPEEIAYRNMVLKNEYKDLHTVCGSIIMQTGYFPNVTATQPLLKRIINSLQNFRKYISFYLTNIYDTKSFYENKYQYEVYLQVFNGIKSIFQDLEKVMSHADEESSKEKQ